MHKLKQVVLLIISIYLAGYLQFVSAQTSTDFDSFIEDAISLSEQLLYAAKLEEAKSMVQISFYKSFSSFKDKHRLQLTIQNIRIQGFMNNMYQLESKPGDALKKLLELFSASQNIDDQSIVANYYAALSGVYWSIGQRDSSNYYIGKAIDMYNNTGNYEKAAVLRASRISRKHLALINNERKEKVISLIPEYETEINFSYRHSKYALAYNTRHLAQIHLKQSFDFDEALRLFEMSLSIREEIGFMPYIPASYSSLGDVYFKLGDSNSAIKMYLKSTELAEEINFIRFQVTPFINVGDIYLEQGNSEKAKMYFMKALRSASKNNYSAGIEEAFERINLIFK
jgi:tetratricopeptide (TPR) repeat protein